MTIDTTATEPPRNWFLEIAKAPTEDLLNEATRIRAKLALARHAGHVMDARAYELRLGEVERAIAIHNRRATEQEDQRAASSLTQRMRDALAGALKQISHHNAEYKYVTPDAVIEGWRALIAEVEGAGDQRAAEGQAQREADLREAVLHGVHFAQDRASVTDGGCGPTIDWVDAGRFEEEAARYARSKAGG